MGRESPESGPGTGRGDGTGAANDVLQERPRLSPSRCPPLRERPLVGVLRSLLGYARRRDYEGWDHRDGPNSLARSLIPAESAVLDRTMRALVEGSPVEVRPFLGVRTRHTPTCAALFALANLDAHRLVTDLESGQSARRSGNTSLVTADPDVDFAGEARDLAWNLLGEATVGHEGFCVGHDPDADDAVFGGPSPSVEATSLAVRALVAGEHGIGDWPARFGRVARSAEGFVVEALDYRSVANGAVVDAAPDAGEAAPPDVAARCGALLLDLYAVEGDERLRRRAEAVLDHVASKQVATGGWQGDDGRPLPGHRIATLLGGFLRHWSVTEAGRYSTVLSDALRFYHDSLFEDDGAPRWSAARRYPRDVRAAAQGALTFVRAGAFDVAERILGWTLSNLYDDDEARVYRRRGRVLADRTTLMEWGQAWTCYAVAQYLLRARAFDRG